MGEVIEMSTIHENLKQLRLASNMTQEQVAQQLHLTRQAVSSHESGRTQPSIELLQSYAALYGVTLEELIFGTNREGKKRKRVKWAAVVTAAVYLGLSLAKALLYCICHTVLGLQPGTITPELESLAQAHFQVRDAGDLCGELSMNLFSIGCLVLLILTLMLERPVSWKSKLLYFVLLVGGGFLVNLPFLLIDPVAGCMDYLVEPIWCMARGALFLAVSMIADPIRIKRRKQK